MNRYKALRVAADFLDWIVAGNTPQERGSGLCSNISIALLDHNLHEELQFISDLTIRFCRINGMHGRFPVEGGNLHAYEMQQNKYDKKGEYYGRRMQLARNLSQCFREYDPAVKLVPTLETLKLAEQCRGDLKDELNKIRGD